MNDLSFPSSPATCLIAQGSGGIKYPFILLFEFGHLVCGRRLKVPPVLCRLSYGVAQTFTTSDINDVSRRKSSKAMDNAHALIHSARLWNPSPQVALYHAFLTRFFCLSCLGLCFRSCFSCETLRSRVLCWELPRWRSALRSHPVCSLSSRCLDIR